MIYLPPNFSTYYNSYIPLNIDKLIKKLICIKYKAPSGHAPNYKTLCAAGSRNTWFRSRIIKHSVALTVSKTPVLVQCKVRRSFK